VILVGIDDTDVRGSRGTNQIARFLCATVGADLRCVRIVRHQLLDDPRVPYTSHNGSASIALEPIRPVPLAHLIARLRQALRACFVAGSDPGLCVAEEVPPAVVDFGRLCQSELVTRERAREVAAAAGLHLEGLGGTEDGVIGALGAVGLAITDDDGRVVQLGGWPDDLHGLQPIDRLDRREVAVRLSTGAPIRDGWIDVGKKLRPNRRGGATVLVVEPTAELGPDGQPLHRARKLP
jgi:hypothetical protein